MIYSGHCQNQGEEIYICFHLSKIQLLQENPTVRCSCYEFYFGKVIAFGKIQIGGKFVGRLQVIVQRKDFTEA